MNVEEIHSKFPFLRAQPKKSHWVYGNCDGYSWWNNIDKGWQELAYNMFSEISEVLKKYHLLRMFEIEQLKEKWSELDLYYAFYPQHKCKKRLYKKRVKIRNKAWYLIYNIIYKYKPIFLRTCICCGKSAKYRSVGYVLPYCYDCVKDLKNCFGNPVKYKEINGTD